MTLYQTIPILERLNLHSGTGGFAVITDLGDYISSIVGLILSIAGLATIIYLVYGGLKWIMSGSDKTKVEEARSMITNAVIGIAIVAVSWAVFLLADYFFGLGVANSSGISSSGSSSGSGYTPPSDYCVCGNNAGCATVNTIGPLTYGGSCYQCQSSGSWTPYTGTDPCPDYITCNPCP